MADPAARATGDETTPTTRDSLLELATARFVDDGYARTSVRHLARESARTTGALYGHFRNKADLLAEVIAARIAADLEDAFPSGRDWSLAEALAYQGRRYRERAGLRALLLEGATAARQDDHVRRRVGRLQADKLAEWAQRVRDARDDDELEGARDLDALFTLIWALELGIGALEAYGLDLPSPDAWADLIRRLLAPEGPPPS